MTLSSFLTSGYELPTARLLLVLTAIHPSRKVQKKDPSSPGHPARMTDFVVSELVLADRTGECKLTLFDHATVPFKVGTVLLITGATMKRGGEKACISLGQESLVDAEPEVGGVEGLRRWAERERRVSTKRQEVPDKVMEMFEKTVGEAGLYTLAELEERVREEEGVWTVWLSLVVGQVNLVRVVRRGMAAVGECCGIPIYSLEPTNPCLTCGTVQTLSINPAVIGSLLDETGALEAEKLQWTPKAWKELLGEAGAVGVLSSKKGVGDTADINGVRELQERITGLREIHSHCPQCAVHTLATVDVAGAAVVVEVATVVGAAVVSAGAGQSGAPAQQVGPAKPFRGSAIAGGTGSGEAADAGGGAVAAVLADGGGGADGGVIGA
ncbi:hypothetical protein V499_04631 [Pseudogymnoascus sp. VKM F-103]|nr:hypothetical protein V499_04631 [Pseudogymnoascus sp. VKM F-103]